MITCIIIITVYNNHHTIMNNSITMYSNYRVHDGLGSINHLLCVWNTKAWKRSKYV